MSHAVVRGQPLPAQLYLDGVLDEVLAASGRSPADRERLSLAQILFHCLRKHPDTVFMINGATGEVITNGQILERAVSLARALIAAGARGKTVTLLMRNHQRMTAVYLAVLFADVLPFLQDPSTTTFELVHYLKLVEPSFVFCDEEHEQKLRKSLDGMPELATRVVVFQEDIHLKLFAEGFSDNVDDFKIPDKEPSSPVMMLPTSGSTGLPKAALMTNRGLVAQLPGIWLYHTDFPKPTELIMVLTTAQWVTFTMTTTAGIVYQVPRLMSPKPTTVDNVKEMLIKYRPTWTFFGPAFATALLPEITSDHLSSLKTLSLLGAACSLELLSALQDKLPRTAHLCDAYGTTETQGYIAIPDRESHLKSNGRVLNIFQYKLVDENDEGLCQNGQLFIKGISCIEGYYKNDEAYSEAFVDGWYRTGDRFYIDENERLTYLERIKFNFKFNGCHVSPEEVELVIGSVPGVHESVVVCTERGPTAGVVLLPGFTVTREQIHAAVDSSLSEHKRLHGGIAFVASLPHTASGKLQRAVCLKLILKLIQLGECY